MGEHKLSVLTHSLTYLLTYLLTRAHQNGTNKYYYILDST